MGGLKQKRHPVAAAVQVAKEIVPDWKNRVIVYERALLYTISFDLNVQHPFKALYDAFRQYIIRESAQTIDTFPPPLSLCVRVPCLCCMLLLSRYGITSSSWPDPLFSPAPLFLFLCVCGCRHRSQRDIVAVRAPYLPLAGQQVPQRQVSLRDSDRHSPLHAFPHLRELQPDSFG